MCIYLEDFNNYEDLCLEPTDLYHDVIHCITQNYFIDDSIVAFLIKSLLLEEEYEQLQVLKNAYERLHGTDTFVYIINNLNHMLKN